MATSSNTKAPGPQRGEVWFVELDPTRGAEIRKTRPVVILSSDALRSLPLRLIAPITEWKLRFQNKVSHVRVLPTPSNGLAKESAVDSMQLRGVSLDRFQKKIGRLSASEMEEVVAAVAAVIEYQ